MKRTVVLLITTILMNIGINKTYAAEFRKVDFEAQNLEAILEVFNDRIDYGNIGIIDSYYDLLSTYIKIVETEVGKIRGKSNRDKLNETYVRPAKIARERVIYEVSQYRLLKNIGLQVIDGNSDISSDLNKLTRLKKRAVAIKEAGNYEDVPSYIDSSLEMIENSLRTNKFVKIEEGNTFKINDFEYDVFLMTNIERLIIGKDNPLILNFKLSSVAREKANDMGLNNYFSHQSPTYGSPFEMMNQYGISYQGAAENIAAGYQSPEAVVSGWMNSPGHRMNILGLHKEIGIGFATAEKAKYSTYWTQMFILDI
ncbi:CAP domain-containing protein [Metabacillus endolithicus]|uniref:CAP domain-containing protein n=1 Tax=Metabacillus endolithicus TaxID=1535204 RepID=A0ABW5BY46_9BACI